MAYNVVEVNVMNNSKNLLIKLINQLEDEQVQALIQIVKAMIYPPYDEEEFTEIEEKRFQKLKEEYKSGGFVEVDDLNDLFK